jgi:cytochrome c oxidase subunit 3
MSSASTVTELQQHSGGGGGPGSRGPRWRGGGGGDGQGGNYRRPRSAHQLAVIAGLVSVTTFFSALSTAFLLSMRPQDANLRIALPAVLLASTGILIVSSATLEMSRSALIRGQVALHRSAIWLTLWLGVGFIALQILAWLNVARQGLSLMEGRFGSAFYIFTGAHALHVAGGLGALLYLAIRARILVRSSEQAFRTQRAVAGAAALYWHFMGLLWLGIYGLLHFWYPG